MNTKDYINCKFRELRRPKKKTFAFELCITSAPAIIAAAKAIEMAEWMDSDVLIDYQITYSQRDLKIYTDNNALADEMRIRFC